MVLDLPYQLVHRTASACWAKTPIRALIYLLFGRNDCGRYAADLAAFSTLFDSQAAIQFHVLECDVTHLPSFVDVERRWKSKEPEIAKVLRDALTSGPLFMFKPLRAIPLRSRHAGGVATS